LVFCRLIFFYIYYNLILANHIFYNYITFGERLFYDLFYGQKYIPAASLSMLTIISFVGLGAGIYFGISFDEFVKNIKNKIKYKEKKEETEKEEKLSERTLLVINKNSKMIVKSFKGFPDDVLDDLIDGIANWFKLRNVKGVQKFMVFSTEDYGFAAEYVEGKNLREYITMKGGKLSPEKAACICLKIAMILKDCLEHEIIHRDLKPENIIITNNEEIMIVDWEFSTKLGIKPKTFMGTLLYAPKDEIVTDRYDVYSLGKILYLMITGRIEETRTVSIENKEIKALIEKMLSNDPMKRPSMDDIINSLNKICQKQPK
jgi:serine/threonine protein kinase